MDVMKEDVPMRGKLPYQEVWFRGIAVSEGVAIGAPCFLSTSFEEVPAFPIALGEVDNEIARYRTALCSSRADLQEIHSTLVGEGSKDAACIIDTHIQMLEDPVLTIEMEEKIRQTLQNTESVFHAVISDYERRFSKHTDQTKLTDVMDLAKRVLGHLHFNKEPMFASIPSDAIIFVKELPPSYVVSAKDNHVLAFVTHSGAHSHAALLARTKGIPYVIWTDIGCFEGLAACRVIVDGHTGDIIFNPSEATLETYQQRQNALKSSASLKCTTKMQRAETIDGCKVELFANIGDPEDLEELQAVGAEGVGLFRTECLFFTNRQLLFSEQEQYRLYADVVQKVGKLPLVIRVFDISGDKHPDLRIEGGAERGIRFLLRHRNVFETQVRAILRAAVHGNVRILLPLIADVAELIESRALIAEVEHVLRAQGIPCCQNIAIGSMIELPSAVLVCDALAGFSDFFSIGTNDLMQYTLGIDRLNPMLHEPAYPVHPSIIRMIKMVLIEAKRCGKEVSICGELASNLLAIPLLIGLGVDRLSCSPRYIPAVKQVIRNTTFLQAKDLAQQVLRLHGAADVFDVLSGKCMNSIL